MDDWIASDDGLSDEAWQRIAATDAAARVQENAEALRVAETKPDEEA